MEMQRCTDDRTAPMLETLQRKKKNCFQPSLLTMWTRMLPMTITTASKTSPPRTKCKVPLRNAYRKLQSKPLPHPTRTTRHGTRTVVYLVTLLPTRPLACGLYAAMGASDPSECVCVFARPSVHTDVSRLRVERGSQGPKEKSRRYGRQRRRDGRLVLQTMWCGNSADTCRFRLLM